jgi:hypothetical protein
MNILVVGGRGMTVNDGSAYWTLDATLQAQGHSVELAECVETGSHERKVTLADLLYADSIVCYSYGCASVKEIWHDNAKTWPADKRYNRWIVVAGVPDVWMEQFYGSLWHKPLFVDVATNYQVDAVPASCELQDVAFCLFGNQPDSVHDRDYVINCNALVGGYINPVDRHTHIQNHPDLLKAITTMLSPAAAG